jgi:transcriptional regulator with XRE-family HTH domain
MTTITLQTLGRMIAEKRGDRGLRETAKEIGTSHATLSRVERGYLPDLETFGKICKWLNVDPGEVLGARNDPALSRPATSAHPITSVHFKKDQALHAETATALAELILAAQRAWLASDMAGKEEWEK